MLVFPQVTRFISRCGFISRFFLRAPIFTDQPRARPLASARLYFGGRGSWRARSNIHHL